MSPEQARGKDVDKRTDVWAFGCLLYELLAGKRAFRGETVPDTIAAILEREPDWRALPANTPAGIKNLLRRCLQKDAQQRLPDMKEVRTRIEEAADRRSRRGNRWQLAALVLAVGVLLAGGGLAAWLVRQRGAPADQMLHPIPLTSYLGSQHWPSFSPDGNQVAFSWDGEKQDNFDIYVKRVGPGPPLRLTHDSAADRTPAWAPDGSWIAFLRASRPGKATVVMIPPLGGPERVLTEVAVYGPMNQCLTWSPDSKWLAAFDRPASQPAGLWLLSVETGERRRLTTVPPGILGDLYLSFSPDGRALAFTRLVANNSSDLYLLSLGEDLLPRGEPHRLIQLNQVLGLAWTADGRELVFSSGPPGNVSLSRMAISGEARPRRLTEQGDVLNLAISGRSNRLVFVQSRRDEDIYRVELSGNGGDARASMPLIASSRLDRYPRYSPDGNKIAFASLRSGNWQLWVSDGDGANTVQMTFFERGEVAYPSWTANGRQIGFTSNAVGAFQAYFIDAAGGRPQKLEALGTNVYGLSLSRDGRWIFFPSSRGGTYQMWKMPTGGGVPEQMTRQGAGGGTTAESPDGKLVYYTRSGGVWSVPVEGGEEHEIFKSDVDQGWLDASRWGIYFVTNSTVTKPGDLMFYRFPKGPITKVAGVQTRYGFSISPDGRDLLYTKMTSTGSDLMMVENFR